MRKFKFRAYDTIRKEFLTSGQIYIPISSGKQPAFGVRFLDIISDPNKYTDRFIIEEFTGYCDKNGIEMFEGDIIKNDINNIFVIIYAHGNLVLADRDGNPWNICVPTGYAFEYMGCNVIGNIHDNPELLKGGEK